jgi:hypothetical protein
MLRSVFEYSNDDPLWGVRYAADFAALMDKRERICVAMDFESGGRKPAEVGKHQVFQLAMLVYVPLNEAAHAGRVIAEFNVSIKRGPDFEFDYGSWNFCWKHAQDLLAEIDKNAVPLDVFCGVYRDFAEKTRIADFKMKTRFVVDAHFDFGLAYQFFGDNLLPFGYSGEFDTTYDCTNVDACMEERERLEPYWNEKTPYYTTANIKQCLSAMPGRKHASLRDAYAIAYTHYLLQPVGSTFAKPQ